MRCWPRWCASQRRNWDRALDRLIRAGLLFRQGVPPHATYLFKHALVQDAAYGTLAARADDARCTPVSQKPLKANLPTLADGQPEIAGTSLHRGRADRRRRQACGAKRDSGRWSARRWSKPQLRLTGPSTRFATLPATPALRREEIKLQVALIAPLMHVKGYAAPETRAAAERAHLLIEQADALGEPTEDPLLLFSVLYSIWVASFVAFNGDVHRQLAAQFLALAEKQKATSSAHDRSSHHGEFLAAHGRHRGSASPTRSARLTLYDPPKASPLATRFGQDLRGSQFILAVAWPCGCLVIPTPRVGTQTTRSGTHVRSAMPPH